MKPALRYPAIAAGGVLGATIRWAVAEAVSTGSFPWATFLVNVAGAALLGWVGAARIEPTVGAALGTGFCGGMTTFSTFSVEVVELLDDGRLVIAVLYGLGSLVAAIGTFMLTRGLVVRAR